MASRFDELAIRAEAAEVRRASEWLEASCRRHAVPPRGIERLVLCLNEVLENVIVHGGAGAHAAPIDLRLQVTRDAGGGEAAVTVADSGAPFDPGSIPVRPLPKTLDEASVGGLGLVMLRRCADWLRYRREAGRNHLTFAASWTAP